MINRIKLFIDIFNKKSNFYSKAHTDNTKYLFQLYFGEDPTGKKINYNIKNKGRFCIYYDGTGSTLFIYNDEKWYKKLDKKINEEFDYFNFLAGE